MRSFWLCKNVNRKRALQYQVVQLSEFMQLSLFPDAEERPMRKHRRSRRRGASAVADDDLSVSREATTLDRFYSAAMLLQAGSRANALRNLLKTEQDRGPDFLRLANALSAVYPVGSEEKRLLEPMLLALPR